MKKVGILFCLFFVFASLQLHAQKLTASETEQLRTKSIELRKQGSQNMLEFMSTGDISFYDKAIQAWHEAKSNYKRLMKDGTSSGRLADLDATYYDMALTVVDGDLTIYEGDLIKNHVLGETEKDRTKKVKAGGKEYNVSKYCQSFASTLAKSLK